MWSDIYVNKYIKGINKFPYIYYDELIALAGSIFITENSKAHINTTNKPEHKIFRNFLQPIKLGSILALS